MYQKLRSKALHFREVSNNNSLDKIWQDRENQPKLKKIAVTAICGGLKADTVNRAVLRACIGGLPESGHTELGFGYQQFVLLSESKRRDEVRKIIFDTTTKDIQKTEYLSQEFDNQYQILASYLGESALKTEYKPTILSSFSKLRSARWAVSSLQPYVEAEPVFSRFGELNEDAIYSISNKNTLNSFIASSVKYNEETGNYVDLVGYGNLGVSQGELLLIDTVPLDSSIVMRDDAVSQEKRLDQLSSAY